jgi:hypothetical protein
MDDRVFWVSRASGAYSFTDIKQAMTKPATIKDHKQAVQLALAHIADKRLVELGREEELDVVSVYQVMAAAVYDGEDKPFSDHGSDYIVKFGRRYQGTPVLGSYLQLQLGPKGMLMSARKVWRPVIDTTAEHEFRVDASQVKARFYKLLRERKQLTSISKIESAIEIVNTVCGYIEGQVTNVQERMGLGCIIDYRHSNDEMVAKAILPLAEYDFPITGKLVRFEATEQKRTPTEGREDADDKRGDEAQ